MNKDIIVWEKVNVRPSDYNRHDYNCGDCTTRALTYALNSLGDSRSYKEIEDEQYRLGELYARLKTSHLPNSSTSRAWSVYDRPHLEDRISKGVNFRCSSGIVKKDF